ncbi:hypothetical protein [Paramuribaculum intestinale]|uniref:hypothetical protein n=1 Tax=Paramuribaculum intestinale TaxID=2094151 RepID=UPI0025A9DA03|nr:hypothetical protein [Paramuribaculum intestinale]
MNTTLTVPVKGAKTAGFAATVKRIALNVFSAEASAAVAVAAVAAIWWHNLTIADAVAAGEAVAIDCMLALPWGMAAIIRSWRSAKRGEA